MKQFLDSHRTKPDPVLQRFLDSLTDQAVFTVDLDGIIATWSHGCERLKGYTAEEAIGSHLKMVYTEEDQARGHAEYNLRHALKEGQYHEESLRVRKGGERFMAEVSIYPIEWDGKAVGFSKIVKDVSERRRLEDEREELSLRLKAANVELEGFCQSIAHDLRTPIRAIILRCEFMLDEYKGSLPQGAEAHVDALMRSGVRIGQIVDDLLAFTKLGMDEVVRQDVDASAMARRLWADIVPHRHGGLAQIDVQDGVHAYGDRSMIELVLSNLIENACKYSKADVHIRFGMEVVGGEEVYRVKDDGIGFDMEYADRIFEPFQRLHGVSAYSGTGIGLANVKRIVERHGGRIWADSVPGHGATFSFTLR